MNFRELNYILAIARHQSITKAAESLYVSQPTLSKFLIALERDLGLKLFRRIGHKYLPTYAGERYVDKANQILRLKADLDAELADIIKRDVGVLNVALPRMRCSYLLPNILPAFKAVLPNVKVNVYEGNSAENDLRLLDGEVDVAFYSKPPVTNPLIEYEPLWQEEMLLCLRRGHPAGRFARPNPASRYLKLDPALLKDEILLQVMPEQRTRQIADDYLRERSLLFRNVMYTSNIPAIMELVAVGYGISFIFESNLQHRVGQSPIDRYSFGEPRTVSNFVAAYRNGSYLPAYAREFIEITRRQFDADE